MSVVAGVIGGIAALVALTAAAGVAILILSVIAKGYEH
ncbi:hypothetical protein ABID82_002388 [Methylobacterium sp. PvP062]|uniref:Uncharacterized protein n=1 Tax=Methylobacterium radiotolerans TaxID=31998 RepID=A0ABV2NNB0_9HYPH|nr:hypothetical protein [Methylobacterium sp. PvP105]MBP2504849.1 hypothetical protein [Methylobacterium sp. PvP109]